MEVLERSVAMETQVALVSLTMQVPMQLMSPKASVTKGGGGGGGGGSGCVNKKYKVWN